MQNVSLLLKKYSVPFLFSALGIVLVIVSLTSKQPFEFVLAAVIIFICSIFLFLSVSGKVSNRITGIIGGSCFIIAGYALYSVISTVDKSIEHNNNYALMKGLSIRNLKDIKKAQKEYNKKYNTYASNWNELINFIELDSVARIERKGSIPNRKITEVERDYLIQFGLYKKGDAIDNKMSPKEAYFLSKSDICPDELRTFKMDTIMVSFIETQYTQNNAYLTERKQNNYGEFNAKNLRYIPFTNNKAEWKMDTVMNVSVSDTVCLFRIEGILPIPENEGAKADEIMCLGSIKSRDEQLSGSWEDDELEPELQLVPRAKSTTGGKSTTDENPKTEGKDTTVEKPKTGGKGTTIKKPKTGGKDTTIEKPKVGGKEVKSKIRIEFEKIFTQERRKRINAGLNPDEGTFTFRGKLFTTEMATLN